MVRYEFSVCKGITFMALSCIGWEYYVEGLDKEEDGVLANGELLELLGDENGGKPRPGAKTVFNELLLKIANNCS